MVSPGSNSWDRDAKNETDLVWGVCVGKEGGSGGAFRLGEKCQAQGSWPYNLLGKRIKAGCLQISAGQARAGEGL